MNDLFPTNWKVNLSLVARQVLMSAYLYYKRDESVLTDHENDALVQLLSDNWVNVSDRYKILLDPYNDFSPEDFSASTFQCRYTRLVEDGAITWLKKMRGYEIERLNHGYYKF